MGCVKSVNNGKVIVIKKHSKQNNCVREDSVQSSVD